MQETWYRLEDGTAADPRHVVRKNGKLVHKDGRKVAYAPHGPRSVSIDPEAERAKAKKPAPVKELVKDETRDLTAEKPKRGYTTRKAK